MSVRPKSLLLICAVFVALSVGVSGYGLAFLHTRYENLGNPTVYVFSVPVGRIKEALKVYEKMDTAPLRASFYSENEFGFSIPVEYYTKRYWTGPREKDGDVDPPEAGKIGTLQAGFNVRIFPEGDKCRLKVEVRRFELQVGRHYVIYPHFHKTGKDMKVKSDTYFEYLFLAKVGELVGEKGMPPLKGSGEDDDWPGRR